MRDRTRAEHPLGSFGPGSLKTLLPRGNSKELGVELGWRWGGEVLGSPKF